MADPLILRRAVPSDAQDLTRVVADAFQAMPELDAAMLTDGLDQDITDHMAWVAELSGQIVGGIILIMGDVPQITILAVDPTIKGQGLGRKLVAQTVQAARDAGRKNMRLTTHKDMTGTRAFYDRLGWSVAGQDGDKVYMTFQL